MSRARWAFVAYWAANMERTTEGGLEYPGFSYSDDERAAMKRYATAISNSDYWISTVIAAPLAIFGAALLGAPLLGLLNHLKASGIAVGDVTFMTSLAVWVLISFVTAYPTSLTLATLWRLRGRPIPDQLDWVALRALHRRILWQFFRVGAGGLLLSAGLGLVLGRDERILRVLGPVLSVAGAVLSVTILTMMGRGKRQP